MLEGYFLSNPFKCLFKSLYPNQRAELAAVVHAATVEQRTVDIRIDRATTCFAASLFAFSSTSLNPRV